LFLERVSVLCLQVEWGIPSPQDPRMKRWVNLMARHSVSPIVEYNDVFFDWLRTQMLMIYDYAYVGIYFHGYPYLSLLEGSQWGNIGKNEIFLYHVFIFIFSRYRMFFYVVYPMTNQILFENADVRTYRSPSSSPIKRRGERGVVAGVVAVDFNTIEHNLEGLIMNILDASIEDIPRHYQRHIVGMFASIGRLLHRVARTIACDSEQHP
jgi:hypothetical protein